MLISPLLLACCEAFTLNRLWWRVCDLGDEICRRCFGNSVNEHTQERNPQENIEPNSKAEQKAFPVMEPVFLLFFCEPYARKVRLKL